MAKFCQSNVLDAETVGLVTSLLAKSKRIMPKLEYQDKWPNIDGYLYFLEKPIVNHDDCSETLGTFEVQVKKLPSGHNKKFNKLETNFLRYCQTTFNPVLLLGVDIESEIIYWVQVDSEFINQYSDKMSQDHVTGTFTDDKIIKKDNQNFISIWETVIVNHRNKIVGYDKIKETLDSYQVISENSRLITAKVSKNYVKIHQFLDNLNNFLDNDFNIVKKVFLPATWKLGFAFLEYEPNNLSYSLFNIPYDTNDVQIKKIILKGDIRTFMQEQKITSFSWSHENIIEKNPKIVAVKWIQDKLKDIIENKLLVIKSEEAINDYLYEFVSHYKDVFGLEIKTEYSIEEIKNAFNQNPLLWIEELYKLKSIPLNHIVPVDLESGFITPTEEEILVIKEKVNERKVKADFSTRQFIFINKRYDFSKFINFLDFCERNNRTLVKQSYRYGEKDLSGRRSYNIWEKWSKNETFHNTKYLYSTLPKIYNETIKNNFPTLFEELKFFKGFNLFIVVLRECKDNYEGEPKGPSISLYYAIDKEASEDRFEFYDESEFPYTEEFPKLVKDGKEYQLIMSGTGIHADIFRSFPTLDYLYKYIKDRIEKYFEDIKEDNQNV
ncbi:MAG: hypothetical protein L6408_00460 [Nanoarchaeota archaeon]|nr:hypothetical protein [Nanoarchaeota archaeon]MCG2719231.1 hypothetical protein [Nanoarchaeota archaeon]